MNPGFYLAAVQFLANEQFPRVMANSGVSQAHIDVLRQNTPWTSDQRTTVRQTLDTVIYGLSDLAALPRTDVPAEIVSAVIATLVSPVNWFACASWLSGLKPAKDLTEAQETIQIERVDGGKMLTLIHTAWSALNDVTEFAAFAKTIDAKFKIGAR